MLLDKLRYRGQVYRLVRTAETEEGHLWRADVAPKLAKCFEVASDLDRSDIEKRSAFVSIWSELRADLRKIGIY